MTLVLCGLPFSGKSSFGTRVATIVQQPFLDTDRLLEDYYLKTKGRSMTCRQIHIEEGIALFRQLEEEVVANLTANMPEEKRIIALGGSTLLSPISAERLRKIGSIVYLKTPLKTLILRMLRQDTLPAYLQNQDPVSAFKQLATLRLPYYEQTAHITLDTANMSDSTLTAELCHLALKNHAERCLYGK